MVRAKDSRRAAPLVAPEALPILEQIIRSKGDPRITPEVRFLALLATRSCPTLQPADVELLAGMMMVWEKRRSEAKMIDKVEICFL